MSAPGATSTCSTCSGELPPSARFCPECGTRVDAAAAEQPPPPETGEVPVRVFGSAPPGVLLIAIALFAGVAVFGFASGRWILGAVAAVVELALVAAYASTTARSREARGTTRLHAARLRSRAVVEQVAAQAQLRRELLRLRADLARLSDERGRRLRELGEAVYGGDETGTETARAAVRGLDEQIAAKEEEMAQVSQQAQERVAEARLESSSTMLLEPGEPPATPEPYPPPVPEPYPPPDEGTPPTPEPVPEPYPPPDEGDPPRQP